MTTHGAQSRINTEVDAVQLLRTMIIYQAADESERKAKGAAQPYEPGLAWTSALFVEVSGLTSERVRGAVDWLQRREYILIHRGSYLVTLDGHAYYSGCRTRSHIGSTAEFRDEVLLGITRKGEPTAIDNAVLPGPEAAPVNMQTPEAILLKAQEAERAKERQAEELGITVEEFDERLLDGSLQVCKGFDGERHLGIFHKKLNRWQHLCRDCSKAARALARCAI